MSSTKYVQEVVVSSQQRAQAGESNRQKREWADPSMVEVMNATAVRNGSCCGLDLGGCGSSVV
jgi:hypothetical protein